MPLAGNVPEGAATVGRAAELVGSSFSVPVAVAVPVSVAVAVGPTLVVALGFAPAGASS